MSTRRTAVIVVGAGPAGLATSRCLSVHGVDHVVIAELFNKLLDGIDKD